MSSIDPHTASAVIDPEAIRHNVDAIARLVAPAHVMAVVKGDGYGHGATVCAQAAREAGASWLGVATIGEALHLRESGDTGPILAWLHGPDEDFSAAVADEIDVTAGSVDQLSSVLMAAAAVEKTARVQLEIDSGMRRAGCAPGDWAHLCEAAAECERSGAVKITGIWSHLATADDPTHPGTERQAGVFADAVAEARAAGLDPEIVHLANSAATLSRPDLRHDAVRLGIAMYGIDPGDAMAKAAGVELRPAMRLRTQLVAVRSVNEGDGVSYGNTWVAPYDTTLGLVPLGYADGILRYAGNRARVQIGNRQVPIVGRVCMDQFMIDLGPDAPDAVGDEVTLFGGPISPTAEDWAEACDTIGYEIVARLGERIPRVLKQDDE